MGSSRGPAWYPPPPKDDQVLPGFPLEREDGVIMVNDKLYRPIAPDGRPIEVRVFQVGIVLIRLVAVGILTGAIVVCIVSVLFHLFGLR